MIWWEFGRAVAVGLLALAGPGCAVGAAAGLRGLWLAGAAPAIGVSLVVVSTLVAEWLSVPWSAAPLAAIALIAVLLAWGVRRSTGWAAGQRTGNRTGVFIVLATLLGIALLSMRVLGAIGQPDQFAQVDDNVFHLNAIRFVLDTGHASPLGFGYLGEIAPAGSFYPSAWHAVCAIISQLAGVSVATASNASLFVFACIVWPVAAVLITRTLIGAEPIALIAAGALSAGFATFPMLAIAYMGTYPLVAAVPLVAVSLGAVVAASGMGSAGLSRGFAGCLAFVGAVGVGGMHPSAFLMLAVLALVPAASATARYARTRPDRARLAWSAFGVSTASVLTVTMVLRPSYAQELSWRGTIGQSIGEYFTQSLGGTAMAIVIAALTIVGGIAAWTGRKRSAHAALAMWAVVGVIYVSAAGDDEFIRLLISGPWYADATRVATFAPVVTLPLAAAGAQAVWRRVPARAADSRVSRSPTTRLVAICVIAVVFSGALVYDRGVRRADAWAHALFAPTDDPLTSRVGVGAHERAVIEEVRRVVPEGDLVAGNPRDGSSFIYALTGRPILVPHILAKLSSTEQAFLDGFAMASPADPACLAARELDVDWVVEFHPDKLLPNVPRYRGLTNLDDSMNAELVFRSGTSSLYRVVGCGNP